MDSVDKKSLSERDICTKFITPALERAGWDMQTQFMEEFPLTNGRISVRGNTVKRDTPKRADCVLFYKPNLPIAVIEAKDNDHTVGQGMQQALEYADMLDVPLACDQLEEKIRRTHQHTQQLTESIIHHLLAG